MFIEIIEQTINAKHQSPLQKTGLIETASIKLELLKILLQTMWELKYLDNKKYIAISDPLNEIGKMLGGWLKYIREL